jgi:hypothetical protein
MTWTVIQRGSSGAVPSSVKPARPWSVGRQDGGGETEWLRDARGRIRAFADEISALEAVRAVSAPQRRSTRP